MMTPTCAFAQLRGGFCRLCQTILGSLLMLARCPHVGTIAILYCDLAFGSSHQQLSVLPFGFALLLSHPESLGQASASRMRN